MFVLPHYKQDAVCRGTLLDKSRQWQETRKGPKKKKKENAVEEAVLTRKDERERGKNSIETDDVAMIR